MKMEEGRRLFPFLLLSFFLCGGSSISLFSSSPSFASFPANRPSDDTAFLLFVFQGVSASVEASPSDSVPPDAKHSPTPTAPSHEEDDDDDEEFIYQDSAMPSAIKPEVPSGPHPGMGSADAEVNGSSARSASPPPRGPPTAAQSRQAGPPPKRSFVPEMFFLCLFLLVVLVAIRGKKENVRVADAWIASVAPLLKENFVSVGYQTSYLLMKSYNIFEIYCTGRRNCFYLHGVLQCLPRQCLWRQYVIRQFFKSSPEYTADSITLEVLLPHSAEPSVVALCRRADQKRLLNDNWDLREFGKLRTSATNPRLSQLPANLVAFSDTSEALDAAFLNSKSIVKTLNSCSSFFRFLYISDICLSIHPSVQPTALSCTASRAPPPASDKTRRILRISFFLPPPEKVAEVEPLLRLLFFLTDSSRQLSLNDKTIEVARKMRMQYQKELMKKQDAQRLEQMEKKRSERKRQEEERFERMTPDQQRKFEEKEYKKSLKQKGRFKVFKVG